MKTQTKPTSPKLAPIRPLQPHTPADITLRQTPKPGQGQYSARDLTTDEVGPSTAEWAEYGKSVHANHQAQLRRYREIAELKRQAELLNHSMNVKTAGPGLVEVCSLCNLAHVGDCLG